ncbi:hypothetical protein APSETT444_009578 [Aspergillus pseudonomiae]
MESISGAATQHLKVDVYDQTMAVNARGTMLVLRAVSAAMAKEEPRMHQSARHTIDNLKNHIRVNIAAPFHTETAMFEANLKRYPGLGVAIKAMTPLKRAASPEEIADPIVFLCSPGASYTNGATLIIDS